MHHYPFNSLEKKNSIYNDEDYGDNKNESLCITIVISMPYYLKYSDGKVWFLSMFIETNYYLQSQNCGWSLCVCVCARARAFFQLLFTTNTKKKIFTNKR